MLHYKIIKKDKQLINFSGGGGHFIPVSVKCGRGKVSPVTR